MIDQARFKSVRKRPEANFRKRALPIEIMEIEQQRTSAQIKLSVLCRVAGITDRAYRGILRGQYNPRVSTIAKLSAAIAIIKSGRAHLTANDPSIVAEIRTFAELRDVMRARRKELGWSQQRLDEEAGFPTNYTSKLELGRLEGGRGFGEMSLPIVLQALRLKLRVVEE